MDWLSIIRASVGKFLRISFIKRSTGETREMVCKVDAMPSGGKGSSSGLITLFSVGDGGYRSIPLKSIISIKAFQDGADTPIEEESDQVPITRQDLLRDNDL